MSIEINKWFPYFPFLSEGGTVTILPWEVAQAFSILDHAKKTAKKILLSEEIEGINKIFAIGFLYNLPDVRWALETLKIVLGIEKEVEEWV